jgi:hypothetical protein
MVITSSALATTPSTAVGKAATMDMDRTKGPRRVVGDFMIGERFQTRYD